jgi:hypothetical protein
MKLRTDLLKHLLDKDIIESVEKNNHRYKAEPLFAKTGTGSLVTASAEEKTREVTDSERVIAKVQERAQAAAAKSQMEPG